MASRPIRLLLDASAIIAFTRGALPVGELVAEIADEGGAAGIPMLCLVEAFPSVTDTDRLDMLVKHPAVTVLTDEPGEWQALAAAKEITGRVDAASAALWAVDLDVDVLTAQPGLYAGLADGGHVIEI